MEVNETTLPLSETPVTSVTETPEPIVEETVTAKHVPIRSKEEVIQRLREINENVCDTDRSEIDALKQAFYRQHDAEQETARTAFVEQGGKAEDFIPPTDPIEQTFKELINSIRQKRNVILEAQEKEKEENLQKKLAILEKMKAMSESPEDADKVYNDFKQLQQEWNEIKLIPATRANELWKNYQLYNEKFYDMRKLNNEFREYDFKKNLEQKIHLCEAAEKLEEEPDPISAFYQLVKLHQEYRAIGPVAKDLRESVWARFKAASTIVNRRHQQYFIDQKEQEQHNLDQKTVICEIAEAMEYDKLKTFADWDKKTKEMQALQAKWKTIGRAPVKENNKIFSRFRKACNEFFSRKSAFFKQGKEIMAQNYAKKKALCEKAEALKESTDWKETAEELAELQKEWKETGPVLKRYSNELWTRFIGACDYFFQQKAKVTSSRHSTEAANLEKKEEIIKELVAIDAAGATDEATIRQVRALAKTWNTIGFVPFKEKDRLYDDYHKVTDRLFAKLNLSPSEKRSNSFKSNAGRESNPQRERDKLVRTYESLKSDIQTYENNLGFLNSSSKKGNSLVTEISRKIERLRNDLGLIEQKIRDIDEAANG